MSGPAWPDAVSRWLLRIRLVRLPAARPAPTPTTVIAAPTTALTTPTTVPTTPTVVGAPAATLTVGAAVQVGPVPPAAAPPVIDPFLRRASP